MGIVRLGMRAMTMTALRGSLGGIALACFGCASQAAPPARPAMVLFEHGPANIAQPAYGAVPAGDFDNGEVGDDEPLAGADSFAARQRRKKSGGLAIPWLLPRGWAPPQGWPLSFPWAQPAPSPSPKPGKQGEPLPSPGAPAAIAYARSKLGVPYCWGGTGPGCYDCSGLTSQSWKAGGKAIPRTSEAQAESLPEVALERALPGDILWRPGHVALYIGGGKVIQAPHTGDVVRESPAVRFVKALRP